MAKIHPALLRAAQQPPLLANAVVLAAAFGCHVEVEVRRVGGVGAGAEDGAEIAAG